MKTFVIAQHHGTFLTLSSLASHNITDVTVIIPGSQVAKYNKMYAENSRNPEYSVFRDYDKLIMSFIKENNLGFKAYVVDDFDIRNTFVSTLKVINEITNTEIVACLLSGSIVNRDFRSEAKGALAMKRFGMCYSRVYQGNAQLSMYGMLGLPPNDPSVDLNFFLVDMSKITYQDLSSTDSQVLSEGARKKQMSSLPRDFNGKDDILIGTAISARQTIAHNLKMQSGFIVNLWNKSIKPNSQLKSEEIYGYPFDIYSRYCENLDGYLPRTTINKIRENGNETAMWTSGLYDCLDIIDL